MTAHDRQKEPTQDERRARMGAGLCIDCGVKLDPGTASLFTCCGACCAIAYPPKPPAPSLAVPDEEPTPQQMFETLLAKKLEWFEQAAVVVRARFDDTTTPDLIRVLDDMRIFMPPSCHWAINIATSRLDSLRSESEAVKAERATAIEAMLKTLHESSSDYEAALESARSESEALRRDKERLDWMEARVDGTGEALSFGGACYWSLEVQRSRRGKLTRLGEGDDLRDAIDAARSPVVIEGTAND